MHKNRFLIALLLILFSTVVSGMAYATSISSCTFEKEYYYPGQTGFITVSVHNDKDFKIRVNSLTADIDYYYLDGIAYEQTFFTNATLPVELESGETKTFFVPFSLPTNIAPGYTQLYVRAENQFWNNHSLSWSGTEYPSYRPILHIESPYKLQFQELQATNNVTTIMMYLLGITTLVFAAVALSIFLIGKRTQTPAPAPPSPQ